MFESWFDHINFLLHTHPHMLAQLAFFWRLKCWLLNVLVVYFLYRIYKAPAQVVRDKTKPAAVYFFEA